MQGGFRAIRFWLQRKHCWSGMWIIRDCLVTRLQENGYPEARIVHRLDWETSGLIVLARDADSHRELSRQFHDRETEKTSPF